MRVLAENLKGKILYNTSVRKINKKAGGYSITVENEGSIGELQADKLLSTSPAYALAEIIRDYDPKLFEHLSSIYYPPVMVLYLGYEKKNIGKALDGFGFLIPMLENRKFLGAIWSSTIFVNRSPADRASFTIFVGGAQKADLLRADEAELIGKVVREFEEIMEIKGEPDFMRKKLWDRAIPQYNLGYIEHENYFERFENENDGFFLGGNYRGGISVGDCIKNSGIISDRIIKSVS